MKPADAPVAAMPAELKHCCANLYESDLAKLLLGDSFHPGGLGLTGRLGQLLQLSCESRVLDVASGRGASALFLAERFGCEVVGSVPTFLKSKEIRAKVRGRMSAALSLGQYLATLKSDSHAELSFLQFFFYPKNLPEAPHPLTLRLRLYRRHGKYQPNLRTLLDELISIEENAS